MSSPAYKRRTTSVRPDSRSSGHRPAKSTAESRPAPGRWRLVAIAVVTSAILAWLFFSPFRRPATEKKVASAAESASPHHWSDEGHTAPRPLFESVQAPTTESVLTARGAPCLECAKENGCLDPDRQGGACEEAHGDATACGQGVTEKAMCLKILNEVFTSKCAETLQQVPCLCGTTDAEACLAGTETPTGPLYREYQCSFNTSDVGAIQAKFRDPTFGAGQANALVQCLAGYNCDCFAN